MSMDEVKPLRLLLVEDNPGDARLLQEELKEVGKCQAHDHDPHDHPPSRVRVSM